MDREALNQRWWYRALKVIFILSFIFWQFVGFALTYSLTEEQSYFVRCDNGKEIEHPGIIWDNENMSLYKQCDAATYFLSKSNATEKYLTGEQKQQFSLLVSQMINEGVFESKIQIAANDFLTKYATANPDKGITLTRQEFQNLYPGHSIDDSFKSPDGSFWVRNFTLESRDMYSSLIKAVFYCLSFLAVSAMIWLLSRVFFYVFIKEKFMRLY